MDPLTLTALVLSCAPLVDPSTARAVVAVESGSNPHAIGIVGGALQRRPSHHAEAIATALALQAEGRNFSVGLAQINRHNLGRLGLTLPSAFEPCVNLRAMQAVLIECFDRAIGSSTDAQHALRRALSCYYSGDFSTGLRHGYVARVVRAARHDRRPDLSADTSKEHP